MFYANSLKDYYHYAEKSDKPYYGLSFRLSRILELNGILVARRFGIIPGLPAVMCSWGVRIGCNADQRQERVGLQGVGA